MLFMWPGAKSYLGKKRGDGVFASWPSMMNRDLLDFTLRRAGHHVDSVPPGRQALELFADQSYDVILSDLRMPDMTGEDLYRRIERGWPHLARRVAFVTASSPSDVFQAQ